MDQRIEEAVEQYLAIEAPRAAGMVEHLFAELPPDLETQRKILDGM